MLTWTAAMIDILKAEGNYPKLVPYKQRSFIRNGLSISHMTTKMFMYMLINIADHGYTR